MSAQILPAWVTRVSYLDGTPVSAAVVDRLAAGAIAQAVTSTVPGAATAIHPNRPRIGLLLRARG
jgi:hypothetical protein